LDRNRLRRTHLCLLGLARPHTRITISQLAKAYTEEAIEKLAEIILRSATRIAWLAFLEGAGR
jgi:hypothetical protein